jgi:hypothetical protein
MLYFSSKDFRAKCSKGRVIADGATIAERTVLAGTDKPNSTGLLSDQRGAAALEMTIVSLFMMLSLLLPLADLAAAGFQYISAWEALRAFGQYLQYKPPADVTNTSSWITAVHPTANAAGISDPIVACGDNTTGCSNASLLPKYYSYTTTVTFAPLVLSRWLCTSGNANPCKYTMAYSERFQ